jgi:hypothetical protein
VGIKHDFRISFLFLVFLCLCGWASTAEAHTEIFFPKIFTPAELPNSGFVLLNPDPIPATVFLILFSPGGAEVARTSLTVPPQGQAARLGSELFPSPGNGGWVYLINDTEGMQAFWLNYDAGLTFLDGAEAAQYDTIGTDQIIPLVAADTQLNVINPNFGAAALTIRLFGSDGEIAPAVSQQLPLAGGFQATVAALFPTADMTRARYVRVQSGALAIASSAMIRGFLVPADSVVINGVNVSAQTSATFPHVVHGALGGANYTTVIGLTNPSTSAQAVTITFNPDGSSPITANRTIPPNGALRETAQSLFGLSTEFRNGWVRVSATASIIAFAAYADTAGGAIAVVPAGASRSNLFFSHIADGPPQWQTGLALLNPGTVPANVEIYAVDPAGNLIGSGAFTLSPERKIANVIHELIPQTRGVNGGYVFVRTSNDVPLFGIELFYTEDLKVLSNVAAGKLSPNISYTPPAP